MELGQLLHVFDNETPLKILRNGCFIKFNSVADCYAELETEELKMEVYRVTHNEDYIRIVIL